MPGMKHTLDINII